MGQSFIDTADKRKWIHLEKTSPVFSYTSVGPDLDIFLELNIEAGIDNQVSTGSTGQTCKRCWELLGK